MTERARSMSAGLRWLLSVKIKFEQEIKNHVDDVSTWFNLFIRAGFEPTIFGL